ncbi:hypothetical protein NLI96_g2176 [Meripilus lineatus]|uniref:non-specific serine/threonine protein kinase n=1 Tax=Meripilus lineatus TaxID=2056292 RepID=A0AAD5V8W0_9APHY|nr:hypothetical protein NLI96_g2176 [Physisporinus lineatus]
MDAAESNQTDDGPDGSDKPPQIRSQKNSLKSQVPFADKLRLNGTRQKRSTSQSKSATPSVQATHKGGPPMQQSGHIPLPPPESYSYQKSPGTTRKDLERLRTSSTSSIPHQKDTSSTSTTDSMTPSMTDSPSPVRSGGKVDPKSNSKKDPPRAPSPTPSAGDGSRSKPPSVHSDSGSIKFTLRDLMNAPKLVRRASMRSNGSSKKSDSDRGGRSTNGESTASLLKKYGVCEKVAIGKGATSVVRLAHKWDRTEEKLYAVKEFRKRRKNETEKEYVKKLTAEFCISSTLHHPNIVETVDLVQDENLHWCEVMEFCPGGDLYAAIKKGGMSPSEVECCFKQILTGVSYLHSQGVAHRDLKPENLFFDTRGHLKIGDYGASTVYRLPWEQTIHMSTGLCGSEPYIAPEQFQHKPYDARLVDIWACGIVYYCLHFQELPWTVAQPSDNLYSAYLAACTSNNPQHSLCPPTINNLSPRACRPVIRKMLEPNPKLRSSIEDIINQPWIKGIQVCNEVSNPSHFHVYAQSMASQPISFQS